VPIATYDGKRGGYSITSSAGAEEEQKMQIDLRRLVLKTDKVAGRDLSVGS
jgi:hypothetical protein